MKLKWINTNYSFPKPDLKVRIVNLKPNEEYDGQAWGMGWVDSKGIWYKQQFERTIEISCPTHWCYYDEDNVTIVLQRCARCGELAEVLHSEYGKTGECCIDCAIDITKRAELIVTLVKWVLPLFTPLIIYLLFLLIY